MHGHQTRDFSDSQTWTRQFPDPCCLSGDGSPPVLRPAIRRGVIDQREQARQTTVGTWCTEESVTESLHIFIYDVRQTFIQKSRSAFQSAQNQRATSSATGLIWFSAMTNFARPGVLVRANLVFSESRYQHLAIRQAKPVHFIP